MPDRLMHDVIQECIADVTPSSNMDTNGISQQPQHPSDSNMLHSASSTSIESLSSYPDYTYSNSGPGLPYNLSSNSLPSTMSNFEVSINGASSMPNLEHMPECDPDYNVTLTPDMYCDMRQAMSMTQAADAPMGVERVRQSNESVPNSPSAESQASFYIESSRHTFTVTYECDNSGELNFQFGSNSITSRLGPNNGMSTVPPAEQATVHPQQQQQQQLLCKSNSLPSEYYDCDPYNNQQRMDYEDAYY
ncbi:hypothetical protein COOONC_27136 [Cooperia oncophora]